MAVEGGQHGVAPNCGGAYAGVQGAAREGWTTGQGTPWGHPALCCRGSPLITAPPNKKLHHLSAVCSGSFPSNFGPKKPAQMFCI